MFSNILDRMEYIEVHEGRYSCFSFANILQATRLFSAKLNVLLFGYLCFWTTLYKGTFLPKVMTRLATSTLHIDDDNYIDGWNAGLPMSYLDDFDKARNEQNSV